MKSFEKYLGIALVIIALVMGKTMLAKNILFFRLVIGMALGYTLTRGYTGFAGSVNRACRNGSTKLMRTLALMFFITALLSTSFLMFQDASTYNLWINPINIGLVIGGILFGIGMSFSSCCASGVLTDVVTALPRGIISLIFFGMGVFLALPIQKTSPLVRKSWFTTATFAKRGGVYLPDLFKFDGLDGYLGAMILTGIFCIIVVVISLWYERKRKAEGTYRACASESLQCKLNSCDGEVKDEVDESMCYKLFVKPWSLSTAAVVLAILFTILMGVTKMGWGASTPYGFWFGKVLMIFGVSPEALAAYTLKPAKVFTMPFFAHPINVQNFGIMLGTAVYLLTSSKFVKVFTSELKITFKQGIFYALGGLAMGVGTRFSNGCNVGALYTPIANLSLSGWIFFAFLVVGGIFGNKIAKKVKLNG